MVGGCAYFDRPLRYCTNAGIHYCTRVRSTLEVLCAANRVPMRLTGDHEAPVSRTCLPAVRAATAADS